MSCALNYAPRESETCSKETRISLFDINQQKQSLQQLVVVDGACLGSERTKKSLEDTKSFSREGSEGFELSSGADSF